MEDCSLPLGRLGEKALRRLAEMLDNPTCGWRRLATAVSEEPGLCSSKELESCSLQVLSSNGSPSRYLLSQLSDRACSVGYLLQSLKKIDHKEAVQYLTAAVVAFTEPIRVEVQPQSQSSSEGGVVSLTCQASGPPGLGYQWFKGKEEVLHGTSSELVLSPLRPEHQGHYICRIHLGEQFVFSQWAQVRVTRSSSLSSASGLFPSAVSRLQILSQPRPLSLGEGDPLSLECVAEGTPPPQYQWYRNKQPLPQAHRACLQISCVTTVDRGQYSCRVYNSYQELWSKQVHVEIGPSSFTGLPWEEVNQDSPQAQPSAPTRQLSPFYATDKVALLMGNMNYKFHRQLRAPMADVHELANLLRQLHFKVVSLLDLDRQEMHSAVREFLLLLDRGVYGLLYYAGHGYENYGNSFMVPIDAPASYTSEHCLWVQDILQRMQERRTGLNVFLLDMCRKRNMNDDIIPQPGALKVTANIVFGYATCVDAEAYEVNKGCLSNGIFMSFLKERLLEDEKVTVLLDKVAEDMGRCEITRGRQALELRSNLSERRALSDRILPPDCEEEDSARNLQWAIAHVLPECRHLCFDCGVRVQLGFAAEFSNIMIIYARILEKPSEIVHCETRLIDFPEDLDVDLKITNRQLPEDTGSLLFTVDSFQFPESSCLYTRLSALQRLKRELKFSVCLQYQYCHMDEFVEEIQTVNVGKPLVAKLNLHESTPPPCSPAFDLRSLSFTGEPCSSLLQSSSFTECLAGGGSLTSLGTSGASSLGSASTCWSYYSSPGELLDPASPRRVNLPEETVSPEFLDLEAPRPLSENPQGFTSSASMPYTGLGDIPFEFRSKQNFNSF
ncbi:mucosa-associated lymphoid tissue lymphoma translocation protein 1-like isoform X1 [Acipenser oxyrinchus oxyrinchus]|uniref:Mucosa-associated lymphoid tissue lymphoma translocation protein 1-like isoform X1 n=1 Tax=Acipenser oxyrinchus oxyrinchus TaxID=40147 RepID=A0AAD8CUM7_ACIOX|nr:mucosa-associated lymphoid tissue lymphoma translocation protein 1-like isoform X1 [Acipenser oxyrinchus oxyrinchus]